MITSIYTNDLIFILDNCLRHVICSGYVLSSELYTYLEIIECNQIRLNKNMPKVERKRKRKSCKPYAMSHANDAHLDEFIKTGRTGRRNALPDILNDKHSMTSTGGLPTCLDNLTFKDEKKSDTACGGDESKPDVKPDDEDKPEKS